MRQRDEALQITLSAAVLCAGDTFPSRNAGRKRIKTLEQVNMGHGRPLSVSTNAESRTSQRHETERGLNNLGGVAVVAAPHKMKGVARNKAAQRRHLQTRGLTHRRLTAVPTTTSVLQLAIQIKLGLGDKAAASRYQQRLGKEFPHRPPRLLRVIAL